MDRSEQPHLLRGDTQRVWRQSAGIPTSLDIGGVRDGQGHTGLTAARQPDELDGRSSLWVGKRHSQLELNAVKARGVRHEAVGAVLHHDQARLSGRLTIRLHT